MNNIMEIDVHGLSQSITKSRIDASLKKADNSIRVIRIIHGYNNGTALRNMIRKQYRSHPKIIRIELSMNQGITDLILKEY